jgi:hypothetical protein
MFKLRMVVIALTAMVLTLLAHAYVYGQSTTEVEATQSTTEVEAAQSTRELEAQGSGAWESIYKDSSSKATNRIETPTAAKFTSKTSYELRGLWGG